MTMADAIPYSRLTDGMKNGQDPDDDPAKLSNHPTSDAYYPWPKKNVSDATDDVGAAGWGCSETYRRLNSRGPDLKKYGD